MRALGAGPAMTASDGLLGGHRRGRSRRALGGAGRGGALTARADRPGTSLLSRPRRGLRLDRARPRHGALVVVFGSVAIGLALQRAPHRVAGSRRRPAAASYIAAPPRRPGCRSRPSPASASPSSPGHEADAAPVRSAILGAMLAVVVLLATTVFGASLSSLMSHPSLYGWNWNYALIAGGGAGDIPAAKSATLLDDDPSVAAWSGVLVRQPADRRPHRAGPRRVTQSARGATHPERPRPRHDRTDRARTGHAGPDPQAGRRHRHRRLRDDDSPPPSGSSARQPCRRWGSGA